LPPPPSSLEELLLEDELELELLEDELLDEDEELSLESLEDELLDEDEELSLDEDEESPNGLRLGMVYLRWVPEGVI
jgi:hypothetical protein